MNNPGQASSWKKRECSTWNIGIFRDSLTTPERSSSQRGRSSIARIDVPRGTFPREHRTLPATTPTYLFTGTSEEASAAVQRNNTQDTNKPGGLPYVSAPTLFHVEQSFSDAEAGEDTPQQLFGTNGSQDLPQRLERCPQLHGNQFMIP